MMYIVRKLYFHWFEVALRQISSITRTQLLRKLVMRHFLLINCMIALLSNCCRSGWLLLMARYVHIDRLFFILILFIMLINFRKTTNKQQQFTRFGNRTQECLFVFRIFGSGNEIYNYVNNYKLAIFIGHTSNWMKNLNKFNEPQSYRPVLVRLQTKQNTRVRSNVHSALVPLRVTDKPKQHPIRSKLWRSARPLPAQNDDTRGDRQRVKKTFLVSRALHQTHLQAVGSGQCALVKRTLWVEGAAVRPVTDWAFLLVSGCKDLCGCDGLIWHFILTSFILTS